MACLVLAVACGDSPTPPSPTPNAPPVITTIIASTERAEVTDEVTFAATVTDAEKPLDQLTYQWTAPAGAITGNGAVATWRPPTTVDKATPFTVTLTVVESYVSGGLPKENRVSRTSPTVQVLNSKREIGEVALKFLRDFANSSVTPEQCVSGFSDNCQGKQDELNDVRLNRENYLQLDHKLGTPDVTFTNADRTAAQAIVRCEFLARDKQTGVQGWAIGNCRLTAVLENLKWWLCESRFDSISTFDRRFVF